MRSVSDIYLWELGVWRTLKAILLNAFGVRIKFSNEIKMENGKSLSKENIENLIG